MLSLWRMPTIVAGNILPARDTIGERRICERIDQYLAVHVGAGREAEQVQDGRCDIEDARLRRSLIPAERRVLSGRRCRNPDVPRPGRPPRQGCSREAANRNGSRDR